MPHTFSRGSRPTICNLDPYVPSLPLTDKQAQEPIQSPHASPVPAPKVKTKKEDPDIFDQVDESKKMDGKKVAMMLGSAIWLTVKFILYVHPLFACF
jgi:hypothetical protein